MEGLYIIFFRMKNVCLDLTWFALLFALFGIDYISLNCLLLAPGYLIWHVDGLEDLQCCLQVGVVPSAGPVSLSFVWEKS